MKFNSADAYCTHAGFPGTRLMRARLSAGLFVHLVAMLVILAFPGRMHGEVSVYEPFDYTTVVNGTAVSGTGLSGTWSCGAAGSIVSGMSYAGLPTANSALSSGFSRQIASLQTPLSSGTKYISFLFKATGNMGGNIDGVFFPNGGSSSLFFGFGLGPFSGTQGQLALGSVSTAGTSATGASLLKTLGLGTYGATYLVVIQIDFDTSGANDTVTVYLNPVANASSPGVAAAGTHSTYDVGTISQVGLNVQGGASIILDEIRIGDTYGDVVGFAPPPPAPTGLTAIAGVNSVTLDWDATSGATGYRVVRGTASGVYTVTNHVASNTSLDATAVGGTTYYYAVQATNSSGASALSSEVSATPTIALPDAPSGLVAVATNGAVNLSWSSAVGAAGYNVKRSTVSGATATIASVTETTYADTDVVNGTTYYYTVSSTNPAGESADSSEVSATPNEPPQAPTGLIATSGDNQVTLSWAASTGATSYNVKRSTTSGSGYTTIATTADLSYADTTAVKFTQYFYVVSAVNGYGESADSSPEQTATPTGAFGPTAYESFNYAIGAFANNTPSTALGFTGNWNVAAFPTIAAGLTYPDLPTAANAYRHAAAGAQTTVNLAAPLSSGTKYISFLFKGSGNSGGDTVGVFFKSGNPTSLFAGFRVPFSADHTGFGLGTVNSTVLGGATGLGTAVNINNTSVHLIVLKIEFNAAGANDIVSMWIDPPAAVIEPGVAANVVNSTFDVGAIAAFGINITGGYNPNIDELRIGDVYGDVVGYTDAPPIATIPTTVEISVAQGAQVSWVAASPNSYQPQQSADNVEWSNFGGLFAGDAVSSVYISNVEPYYRVLELIPGGPGPDIMVNGSFEVAAENDIGAAGWEGPASTGTVNQYVTNQFDTLAPTEGSAMLFLEGQGGAGSLIQSGMMAIDGGLTYKVVFDAANALKSGGGNPQYRVEFFDAANILVGSSGFISFASAGAAWATISNNYVAPANATKMHVGFLQAVGAAPADHWITLVDNIRLSAATTVGATNVLPVTMELGAVFTGTVKTNGVAAPMAVGTITFQTNDVALSTNTLAGGSASSATAIVTPPYTVTAIYSGDSTYIGSTNTLAVDNAIAFVTLGDLDQVYDGTIRTVTATTTPPGLTVNLTYDGSPSAPINAGTYEVIGTVVDALYAGSATNYLVVGKAEAVVTLGGLNQPFNGSPRPATATTIPAGLTVAFTYDGSPTPPVNAGIYEVIGTVVEANYQGSATNTLVVSGSYFGTTPGSIAVSGGSANVTLSGIEGLNYSVQRATDAAFTQGITNFPAMTAPPGGEITIADDFSDLGAPPSTAFYRLQYLP